MACRLRNLGKGVWEGKGSSVARLTCTRFLEFHVASWERPLALAGLNGPFAQQDFALMLHNASNHLRNHYHMCLKMRECL